MNKKKTIFLLLGSFQTGGVERVATLLTENLIKENYDVKVLLLKNKIEMPVEHLKKHIIFLNTERYENKGLKLVKAFFGTWRCYFKYRPSRIISFSSGMNVLLFFTRTDLSNKYQFVFCKK